MADTLFKRYVNDYPLLLIAGKIYSLSHQASFPYLLLRSAKREIHFYVK